MKVFNWFLISLTVALTACKSDNYRSIAGAVWGTTYAITYNSSVALDDSITHCLNLIDQSLSPFVKDSQLSRINRNETNRTDALFRDVFSLSQGICCISGGAFDPTLAPLINLWGFGYKQGEISGPSPQQIDSALATVGLLECHIDSDGILTKKCPDTEFNFSAIAKGYGVDYVADMLERNGCQDYLVEIGGELRLKGKNPRGNAWVIQVDAPSDDPLAHDQLTKLEITDCAIATSGNYRNNRLIGDSVVYHTISPVSGYPAPTSTLSATIIAPRCDWADALATASMALPTEDAIDMLRTLPHIKYILVKSDTILSNYQND